MNVIMTTVFVVVTFFLQLTQEDRYHIEIKKTAQQVHYFTSILVSFVPTETEKHSKQLRGLSPRANYTDRVTTACRWSQCELFADTGVSRGLRGGSPQPQFRVSRQERKTNYAAKMSQEISPWFDSNLSFIVTLRTSLRKDLQAFGFLN
jgi:hypothetical protein